MRQLPHPTFNASQPYKTVFVAHGTGDVLQKELRQGFDAIDSMQITLQDKTQQKSDLIESWKTLLRLLGWELETNELFDVAEARRKLTGSTDTTLILS